MVIPKSAEHEVGGLGTEGEHGLAGFEGRPQLRKGEPYCSRSCISQPIGGDDDPLRHDAKRPGQDRVHSAIGLMRQNIIGWPASCTLRRRRAVQKQFKARAVDRSEIVSELGKSDTAARSVRSAVCHCETRRAPATCSPMPRPISATPTRNTSSAGFISMARRAIRGRPRVGFSFRRPRAIAAPRQFSATCCFRASMCPGRRRVA